MKARIDLERVSNPKCLKNCNQEHRKNISVEDLCTCTRSITDTLPIRCVGEWAEEKIYLLSQYFGIFATGMKNKWSEINYIEICSGPGRCINRNAGIELNGTSLMIMKHPAFQYIHKALFFDYNTNVVNILNQRIDILKNQKAKAYQGDYNKPNDLCNIITSNCSPYSLNLILIDPTDCSVPFELLIKLKSLFKHIDMIINVATGTDFNRNIPMAFKDSSRAKKYSRFLGNDSFFTTKENINLYEQQKYDKLRTNFRNLYKNSMEKIGYTEFRIHQIKHYYDILFAASNPKAIEFWDKAQKIPFNGQLAFDF